MGLKLLNRMISTNTRFLWKCQYFLGGNTGDNESNIDRSITVEFLAQTTQYSEFIDPPDSWNSPNTDSSLSKILQLLAHVITKLTGYKEFL